MTTPMGQRDHKFQRQDLVCQTSRGRVLRMGHEAHMSLTPEVGCLVIKAVPSLRNVCVSFGKLEIARRVINAHSCTLGLARRTYLKGTALPQDSDKLFSASSDGTLQIWDCHTGQCVHTINLLAEAGSLISEGPWVFLGLPNAVKAFNVQTSKDLHLNGVVGQVHAMTVGNGMLFAGTSSGSIYVWKATDTESDPFAYLASLEGYHTGQVTCFIVGGQRLYSGSVDKTIKVWDLNTLECTMTLRQHTDTVTSLLCWDQYLISSSLDGTIKVWACSENGSLKVTNTRRQGQSVHTLCGMSDAEGKPIIFCSYQNGTVSVCDLPSFEERGSMFTTNTVVAILVK